MDPDLSRPPDAAEIRQCYYIRALEEAGFAGERLSLTERMEATQAVAEDSGERFVRKRTARLGAGLKGTAADAFRRMGQVGQGGFPSWIGGVVGVAAFVIGWWTHDLGPEGKVGLLAFPLLGLIVWNLAVVVASLVPWRRGSDGWPAAWQARLDGGPKATGDAVVDEALGRASRESLALHGARWMATGKIWFHVGALLLAAGVVAGLYARGLVRNYEATWESTFLTQSTVSQLTQIVLGPAALLTGIPVPAVPPQGGLVPAAPWIHLWAASAGLFILLPRLLLISMAGRQAKLRREEWSAGFAAYEAAARRLALGQPLVARVLPVQVTPDSPLRDSLRALLQHGWGGQVMVDFLPSVAYGEEEAALAALTEAPSHLVLLLPLAATPEEEVHGTLRRGLEKLLATSARPSLALTVLDASGFETRLAGMPEAERRMRERRAVWEKILGPAWPLVVLDAAARKNPAAAARAMGAASDGDLTRAKSA